MLAFAAKIRDQLGEGGEKSSPTKRRKSRSFGGFSSSKNHTKPVELQRKGVQERPLMDSRRIGAISYCAFNLLGSAKLEHEVSLKSKRGRLSRKLEVEIGRWLTQNQTKR